MIIAPALHPRDHPAAREDAQHAPPCRRAAEAVEEMLRLAAGQVDEVRLADDALELDVVGRGAIDDTQRHRIGPEPAEVLDAHAHPPCDDRLALRAGGGRQADDARRAIRAGRRRQRQQLTVDTGHRLEVLPRPDEAADGRTQRPSRPGSGARLIHGASVRDGTTARSRQGAGASASTADGS